MGVASLVLGIISIVLSLFGGTWVSALIGIVGIVLGALAKKANPENSGMATAGMVCSIIGTVLSLLVFIACVACAASVGALS